MPTFVVISNNNFKMFQYRDIMALDYKMVIMVDLKFIHKNDRYSPF